MLQHTTRSPSNVHPSQHRRILPLFAAAILRSGESIAQEAVVDVSTRTADASQAVFIFIGNQVKDFLLREAVKLSGPTQDLARTQYDTLARRLRKFVANDWRRVYGESIEVDTAIPFLPFHPRHINVLIQHFTR